jgi:endonuclease/exonuclease/phosphatase family metal-dependent hydrolase
MTANADGDYSINNRFSKYLAAQLKQISEVIKTLSAKKNEIIIAGDFNMAKDSPFYEQFIQLSQVTDVFTKFNFPTQHEGYLPKHLERKRIDYIFLFSKYAQATVESAIHLFTTKVTVPNGKSLYLSDHIGLRTDLTFHFPEEYIKENPNLAFT